MASLGILTSVCMCVCVHAYVHVFVSVSEGVHVCVLIFAFCESKRIYMHMLSIWVLFLIFAVFFAFKCMVKKRSGVTGRAEKGESKGWTDCDRDFKVVCEMLASFFYFILFFFYPAGESSRRRLFLPCVVSLEQSNVIFCHAERLVTCQREWEGREK